MVWFFGKRIRLHCLAGHMDLLLLTFRVADLKNGLLFNCTLRDQVGCGCLDRTHRHLEKTIRKISQWQPDTIVCKIKPGMQTDIAVRKQSTQNLMSLLLLILCHCDFSCKYFISSIHLWQTYPVEKEICIFCWIRFWRTFSTARNRFTWNIKTTSLN